MTANRTYIFQMKHGGRVAQSRRAHTIYLGSRSVPTKMGTRGWGSLSPLPPQAMSQIRCGL